MKRAAILRRNCGLVLLVGFALAAFGSPGAGAAEKVAGAELTVGFAVTGQNVLEGVLEAAVPVRLSAVSKQPVTVDYKVTGGTAVRGEDFNLADGTLTLPPGETDGVISLAVLADAAAEPKETIEIALSNPTGAKLGKKVKSTCTIVDPKGLHLKVDLALPVWDGKESLTGPDKPLPGTHKKGWIPWASPRWDDMYDHGTVQLENVGGSGINMMLRTMRGGHMSFKVCGLQHGLAGGVKPRGKPLHEPICNSWIYNCDWAEGRWGDVILVLYNLAPGEYTVKSYHNHFYCRRMPGTDNPTIVDCSQARDPQPNLASIKAMTVKEVLDTYKGDERYGNFAPEIEKGLPEYIDFHGQEDYPRRRPLGPHGPGGIKTLVEPTNIKIQQVTRDADLVASVMRFRTDGSSTHVVYRAGCCANDGVRKSRKGGRAILNAFELIYERK